MGTAYTKTSPTNFVDGETINASDFTTEFDVDSCIAELYLLRTAN